MANPLFPDAVVRAAAFAEAEAYFAKKPAATKFKRRTRLFFGDKQNSFIRDDDGNIYMLALSDDTDRKKNTAYLGHGGFASVKRAIDKAGNEFAVRIEKVKLPKRNFTASEAGYKTGLTQGTLLRSTSSEKQTGKKRTRHHETSSFADIFEENDNRDYAFKKYDIQKIGMPLDTFLVKNKNLNLAARMKIAIHVVQAVDALHQIDIAHLDLKPGNILIDPKTYEITLIDFDFAEHNIKDSLRDIRGTRGYIPETDNPNKQSQDVHALVKTLFVIDQEGEPSLSVLRKRRLTHAEKLPLEPFAERLYETVYMRNRRRWKDLPCKFSTALDVGIAVIAAQYTFSPFVTSALRGRDAEIKRKFLAAYQAQNLMNETSTTEDRTQNPVEALAMEYSKKNKTLVAARAERTENKAVVSAGVDSSRQADVQSYLSAVDKSLQNYKPSAVASMFNMVVVTRAKNVLSTFSRENPCSAFQKLAVLRAVHALSGADSLKVALGDKRKVEEVFRKEIRNIFAKETGSQLSHDGLNDIVTAFDQAMMPKLGLALDRGRYDPKVLNNLVECLKLLADFASRRIPKIAAADKEAGHVFLLGH